ncbi:toprim domain-containing protein [Methylomonas albis]|uniref:Toprim domain-containing protein n=1 Tax=Methylomonas albis TaxID=1854563 RepID=A0ABR9D509_9GAMM|nr:toprim domain-containing protein [Methylomonas albis]MBD9356962.1 toprim domain-containing protein [Methylomonas albis]
MTNDVQTIIDQFRADMAAAGMAVNEPIIADGVLHRVYVAGDRSGTQNGAYILHLDGHSAGYFEHFPKGLKTTWRFGDACAKPLSLVMRRQIEAERKRRQRERWQRQQETAEKARWIWQNAKPVFETRQHPYLKRKSVKPYGIRTGRGTLIVPFYDDTRQLVNLQFIEGNGQKRFMAGGRKKGCFSPIGEPAGAERLLICEGWATGASLHEALGVAVLVAADAGNLEPVALVARRLYPSAEIVIAGDNDASGVGQIAAKKAALAVKGKYLIPAQTDTDWNDVIAAGGSV